MASEDYILVGLTGSIGAGKSTVAQVFEEEGIPVISADRVARDLMQSDPEMRKALIEEFGPEIYAGDELDRRLLASIVFDDEDRLASLNEIVHPKTIARQGMLAGRLLEQGHRVVACEAALIYETGGEGRFDYIVVVDAPVEQRLTWAAKRDSVSLEDIRKREARQIPASQKVAEADFVISNEGSLDDLKRKARMIAAVLSSLPTRDVLDREDDETNDE